MNKDITYCADTVGCPYRYNCKRNLDNQKLEENEKFIISMCKFEHSNTKCEFYLGG